MKLQPAIYERAIDAMLRTPNALPARFGPMEYTVFRKFLTDGTQGGITINQASILNFAGWSSPKTRAFNNALVSTGRWEVRPGTGNFPTFYRPLFLERLIAEASLEASNGN